MPPKVVAKKLSRKEQLEL